MRHQGNWTDSLFFWCGDKSCRVMRGRIFNMYHLCVWKLSKGSNWECHIWKNNAQLLKLLLFFDYWQNFIKKVQRYFLFSKTMYYSWFYVVLVSDVQHSESVTHYTYPFSDSIPMRAITELWVEFPVLYHRSLLIIYFMHSNVTLLLFSCLVVSDSLRLPGLQHARLPCPSPIPGVCSTSCPLNQWYHPTTLSSVIPPSSCLQSLWESGSFPASQLFTSGGPSIGASASASVLPMNIQGWFPLGLTCLISLQPKGPSSVFSSTQIQKHQFFSAQPSLWSNSHPYTTTGKTIALSISVL